MKIVLDTSVLITSPELLINLLENPESETEVILPLTVLRELSNFKHESSERRKQARDIFRYLKEVSKKFEQRLSEPIIFDNGSTLVIELDCFISIDELAEFDDNDSKIICVAKRHDAILYTQDNAMEIIANAFGVETNSDERKKSKEVYEGAIFEDDLELTLRINEIYEDGFIDLDPEWEKSYTNNQYIIIKGKNSKQSAIVRYDEKNQRLVSIEEPKKVFSIKAQNVKQKCAVDLMTDNEIRIAGLIGMPGTGKTYVALATSLDLVLNQRQFKKLIIIKSAVGVGGDGEALGFLPGELDAKIEPIFSNLTGHLKTLLNDNHAKDNQFTLKILQERGIVELKPIQYIRGENFSDSLILVDEMQNFPVSTIKTLLTRVNYNTSKVIFTGDNEQVDNPYLNSYNNGLRATIERLKGKPYFGVITLDKSCRGEITEDLSNLLD